MEQSTNSMSSSTTSNPNKEKSEADMWRERYYSLKRWVEKNMNKQEEWEHPWWKTVNKPSHGHIRKDMDLL